MWDLCYTFFPSKQPAQSSHTWAAPTFSVAAGTKRLSHLMWGTQQPWRNNGKVFFSFSFLVVKEKKNLFRMKLNWLSVLLGSLCPTHTLRVFFFKPADVLMYVKYVLSALSIYLHVKSWMWHHRFCGSIEASCPRYFYWQKTMHLVLVDFCLGKRLIHDRKVDFWVGVSFTETPPQQNKPKKNWLKQKAS